MGCLNSKEQEQQQQQQQQQQPDTKKLDPADFQCKHKQGETLVRTNGKIDGQQFVLDDCEDMHVFLYDYLDSITVDKCKNCFLFIGPTECSIFIRNCTNCKIVAACQQWRMRDCENCDILLYAMTDPIIESSRGLRFGCFQYAYDNLSAQFKRANLDPFSSVWSRVYDFSPAEGNWSFLPPEVSALDLLGPSPVTIPQELPSVVPSTWGKRPLPPANQTTFCAFFGDSLPIVLSFARRVAQVDSNAHLLRIEHRATLNKAQQSKLPPSIVSRSKSTKGGVTGMEISSNDLAGVLPSLLVDVGAVDVCVHFVGDDASTKKSCDGFFSPKVSQDMSFGM